MKESTRKNVARVLAIAIVIVMIAMVATSFI